MRSRWTRIQVYGFALSNLVILDLVCSPRFFPNAQTSPSHLILIKFWLKSSSIRTFATTVVRDFQKHFESSLGFHNNLIFPHQNLYSHWHTSWDWGYQFSQKIWKWDRGGRIPPLCMSKSGSFNDFYSGHTAVFKPIVEFAKRCCVKVPRQYVAAARRLANDCTSLLSVVVVSTYVNDTHRWCICQCLYTVEPLITHTPRWTAQTMPYEGLWLYRGRLKIDLKIRSKNGGRELMDWG